MIAAIEWIPAGRADPTPSKYEYSRAEREFMEKVRRSGLDGEEEEEAAAAAAAGGDNVEKDKIDAAAAADDDDAGDGKGSDGSEDEEWDDVDDDDDDDDEDEEGDGSKNKVELPEVDPSSLPADLRMDDYSDDDDNDGEEEKGVGGLLVGKDAEMMMGAVEPEGNGEKEDEDIHDDDDDDGESDSEDEDDLADIPDTREYMPLDVEGLQSLGIGGANAGGIKLGGADGYTMEDLKNMTMNNEELDDDEEDDADEEDADDTRIRQGDALVVVARTEEDFASLEVNVFDAENANLYVHHDIPLPSFPLCVALGSVMSSYGPGGEKNGEGAGAATNGNYVAVGSFEPGIEIWNLDVMNALEPTLVLGGADTRGAEEDWMGMQLPSSSTVGGGRKKKNKKKKKKKRGAGGGGGLREGSHSDAVMGLSWNAVHRQVLASGSADGTVKLWDVTQATGDYVRPSATLTHHTDKVQSLAWHPSEGTLLATGGYDRRVCLVDARSAASGQSSGGSVKKARLSADCEALVWDPHDQQYLTAASEDGVVRCWDVRKFGGSGDCEPVWSFVAHEYGGVSDVSYNAQVPGMLVTCSIDKTVSLWDTRNNDASPSPVTTSPHACGSKDMNVGKLYAASFYPSAPWLLACGGSGNELAIWDMEGEDAIRKRFGGRVGGGGGGDEGIVADGGDGDGREPDFEAIMATDDGEATEKALQNMNKSKKKKGKKKSKAHKKK